jgi:hypothetical protein
MTHVISMRQSTSATSDFELYRFIVSPKTTQRLTDNAVDDTNVSMSADALKVVWEQPVSAIAIIFIRSYTSATSTVVLPKALSPTLCRNDNRV